MLLIGNHMRVFPIFKVTDLVISSLRRNIFKGSTTTRQTIVLNAEHQTRTAT
jgi:hypothetical protein